MTPVTDPELLKILDAGEQQQLQPVTDPELLKQLESDDKSFFQSAKDLFTGDDRREFDYPEIPSLVWKGEGAPKAPGLFSDNRGWFPAHDALAWAGGNPLSAAQMFESEVPGSKVDFDTHGNPYTEYFGKPYYLNRPGASRADASQILQEGLGYAGAATIGGKLGGFGGVVGKVAGAGLGSGGASVVQDKVAQIMGSEQPLDEKKAVLMTLLGSGGEAAVVVGARLASYLRQVYGNAKYFNGAELTDAGREAIKKAGLDPEVATAEFANEMQALINKGANIGEAARVASARGFGKEVPITEGLATGSIEQQSREQAALHAAPPYGEQGRVQIQGIVDDAGDALTQNVDTLAKDISGGQRQALLKGEGAQKAADAFVARGEEVKGAAGSLLDEAGKRRAMAPRAVIEDTLNAFKADARTSAFDVNHASVAPLIKQAEGFLSMKGVKDFNVGAVETWRRNITRKRYAAPQGSEERFFLGKLVERLDDSLETAFQQSLIKGDQEALKLWKTGQKGWAVYKRVFDSNRLLKRLKNEEMTPEEMTNMFFGAGKLNTSKGLHIDALVKMRNALKPNSLEWKALKEEGFMRLLRNQPAEGFSPQKFVTSFDEAIKNNRTLMNTLFNKEELGKMRILRNQAKATIFDPKALNPSKTSYQTMKQVADFFGPAGRFAGWLVKRVEGGGFGQTATKQYLRPKVMTEAQKRAAEEAGYLVGGGAAATTDLAPNGSR